MDFNSLGQNAPVYVLKIINGEPVYSVGTLKSKINPKQKNNGQPNMFFPNQGAVQVFDIIVSFNGKDEVFTEIPITSEVSNTEDMKNFYSTSQNGISRVLGDLIQKSKKALEPSELERHKIMIEKGSAIKEQIDPHYAEEKKQARTITELQQGYSSLNKRFDNVEKMLTELLSKNQQKSN